MKNKQKDFMFNNLISGFEKSLQATLKLMYTRSCIIDEYNHKREMEQLKKEIEDNVLSRISATVDVSEVVDEIDELRRLIDSLGGK